MLKKISVICVLTALVSVSEMYASNVSAAISSSGSTTACVATYSRHYTKTNHSVTIYCSGVCKGTYAVYLHDNQKYIFFKNCWICIQGKYSFPFEGNWYVIK